MQALHVDRHAPGLSLCEESCRNGLPMIRTTRQRNAIISVLDQADGPLATHELLNAAKKLTPGLGIATVYRTLRLLVDRGEALQVGLPGETPRYEKAGRSHHHFFQCRLCAKVFQVHDCPTDLHRLVPDGFVLEDHEVFLFGLCKTCRLEDKEVLEAAM